MPIYIVTIERTEHIVFEVAAPTPEEAGDRWAMDGDEIGAHTVETTVLTVGEKECGD